MDSQVIILLEDDVVLRQHFAIVLEGEGYKTIGADDGGNVLELIEKHKPDLIITDLFFPDHSGTEAIVKIRSFSKIPIIVITGYENMLKIVKPMVNEAMLKPVMDAQLVDTVRQVLKEPLTSQII